MTAALPATTRTPATSSPLAIERWPWLRGVMGALGLALLGDAVVLMGYGMFNVGVLVPLAVGAALLLIVALRGRVAGAVAHSVGWRRMWRLGWAALILWLASLGLLWGLIADQVNAAADAGSVDAIIVLGSSTRDGQPSATLARRLDAAAQIARTRPDALVVTSGGVDFGERESEGRVMANYLQEVHGLPGDRVLAEEKSTSTALNLQYSQDMLANRGVARDARVAIVTSDFHTLRARWIARKSGLVNITTVGASTPLSIRFNAWLREYFAVASSWLLGEF